MKNILLIIISAFTYSQLYSQCDPTSLTTNNTNSNSTTLSWSAPTSSIFSIKYRILGSTTSWNSAVNSNVFQESSINVDTFLLNSLTTNTTYEWRVKTTSSVPTCTSGWINGPNFSTLLSCAISSSPSIINSTCLNTLDGAIDLIVSGGNGPYTYLWNTGEITKNISSLNPGIYSVGIIDNLGCIKNDTITLGYSTDSITQTASVFIDTLNPNYPGIVDGYHVWAYDTLTITNMACDVNIRPEFIISHNDFAIQQGDFILKWYNPLFSNWPTITYKIDADGNAYGFWNTSVTDSSGTNLVYNTTQQMIIKIKFYNTANFGEYSSAWETYKVDSIGNKIQSLSPVSTSDLTLVKCINFSIDSVNIINNCNNSSNGSASILSLKNGSGQYSYNWSNGQASATAINLSTGIYTCLVTDNNWGCTDSIVFTVTELDTIITSLTGINITCNGSNDGTLNVIATGGSEIYNFNWIPSLPNLPSHSNLIPGLYSLTLTDSVCGVTPALSFTIVEPNLMQQSVDSTNNTSCDTVNCNGSINLSIIGGTLPYSINWSNGDSVISRSNLCGDTYTITSTDANACASFTETITINDSTSNPGIDINSTNISCNGLINGTAEASILSASAGLGTVSTLTYCASQAYTNNSTNIELVRLIGDSDSINNNTTGLADNYQNYTNQYTTVTPNQTYSIDISMGVFNNSSGSAWDAGAIVFIDWNIDGDFDDSGEVIDTIKKLNASIQNLSTLTFTVPNFGIYGPTRLRIVSQYNNDLFGACEAPGITPGLYSPYYGATEDYSIIISPSIPATYLWSTGDTTSQITNLSVNTYTCTVTDTNGCFATDSITITEPSIISTIENTTNILCNNDSNGTVSLIISGGNSPYLSNWGTADTTELSIGTYNYTITDNNGCIFTDSVKINEPLALINSSIAMDVSGCNGNNNGNIDITPSGGTSPFDFLWNNSATTEDLTNISAGEYIITITDSNNCTLNDTITISEPDLLYATYTQTNVSCYDGNNGSASFNFFGGTTDYTFNWNNSTSLLTGGVSSFNTIIGLPAGKQIFNLTDNNGCIFTDTITFNEPNPIQTTAILTPVNCNGDSNGIAILNNTGGTSPYSENWGMSDSSALISGYHSFIITDVNGCTSNDSILITEPTTLAVSEITTNISCNGLSDGNVALNISGGTSPYLENWGTNNSSALALGNNTYTVTDANNCLFTNTIAISEPDTLIVIAITTDVLCNGDSTGTAILTISGGTTGYTEFWNGSSEFNLQANTHHFTVTDTNGCIYTDSVIINEPSSLSSTITPTNLTSCLVANGSINLTINGGVQSYTYLWNNNDTTKNTSNLSAGNYSVTITDANGCSTTNNTVVNQPSNGLALSLNSPNYNGFNISCYDGNNGTITANTTGGVGNLTFYWSTTDTLQNLNNLLAGNYSLMITDSLGCSLTDSIILTEPTQLSSTYSSTNTTCYGLANGSAIVNFNGGIQDYILTWGTYIYPLPGGISTFITPVGVPAGIYPYTVTDMNGCSQSDTITITQPDSLHTNLTLSNYNGKQISCTGFSDGSIDIQGSGGTTSYIYYFNGTLITNTNIIGLVAGTYTDSIIDNNGCIFTETIILTEPALLTNTLTTNNMSCNETCNGSINTQITGGTTPHTYIWNNSITTNNLDSLCAGKYTIDITDNNGCTLTDSAVITEPSAIIINLDSSTNVSVYGGSDGELITTTYGGTDNFTYQWSGPSGFISIATNINNLVAGTYFLTATDSSLCSITDSFILTQPTSLTVYLDSVVNLGCNGICTGELHITADGGDSVYTYLWFGPNGYTSANEDIDSLCSGTYTLELSDTTNTVTFEFEVLEPPAVTIITVTDTAICYNGSAQANAYVYGGSYPYQTLWSNGSTNTSTILQAGNHSVIVTDINGCVANKNITIHQQDSISIFSTINDVSCNGLQDASVILTVINGGAAPFQFSSNNGVTFQNSNSFYNLGSGNHLYLALDANGCSNYISLFVSEPNALLSTISNINTSCFGECDGTATITTTGGAIPYGYDWGTANPNNLCAGLYNVTTTDTNGCLTTDAIIIGEPNPVIVTISQSANIIKATSGFISYQWYNSNGNAIPGATTDTFSPIAQGEYHIEVVDSNGCIGTSLSIFIIIDHIGENEIELNIFPNPTTGKITIVSIEQPNTISVINSVGNLIILLDNKSTFEKQTTIDLSSFAKGFYFIQIEWNNQLINHRVILQ